METQQDKRKIQQIEVAAIVILVIVVAAVVLPIIYITPPHPTNSKCINNMLNISKALRMYKLDNEVFPETLAGQVVMSKGEMVPFDHAMRVKSGLRGDYGMMNITVFRCPKSPETNVTSVAEILISGKLRRYYACDNYDVQVSHEIKGSERVGHDALRYTRSWASDVSDVSRYQPDTPRAVDSPATQKRDWTRQLRWKNPPDDTVITWCGNHAREDWTKDAVLFLDGSCRLIDRKTVEKCRWRTRMPKL